MTFHDDILGSVYVAQTLIGVIGNFFLIYHYSFHFITQKRPRYINLILIQLSFANAFFLLYRGITTAIFSLKGNSFFNDAECTILTYLQRVFRGLSLCCTCLVSSFQAISISPNSPKCVFLKVKSAKYLIPCCVFCWMLNILIDIPLLLYKTDAKQNSTMNNGRDKKVFCFVEKYAMILLKLQLWKSLFDYLLVVLMTFVSGYMVFLLHQHHQRVLHIHRTNLSPRAFPEIKATKAILLLVSTYFLFNSACSVLTIYAYFYVVTGFWNFYVPIFLSMCFQVLSPFVLISSETWVPREFCCFFKIMKASCASPVSSQRHREPQDRRLKKYERKLGTL